MTDSATAEPLFELRALWISDTHLGFAGANAEALQQFLRRVRCEQLYLVGDIIDFWALRKKRHWPQSHNNILRTILGMAKHGTRVVYVPGNHDDSVRHYDGVTLGQIEIHDRVIHQTRDGRRLVVLHGDQFDSAIISSRLLGLTGSHAYAGLLRLNRLVNWGRACLGMEYWSLAAATKQKVKKAAAHIAHFERAVAYEANRLAADGLVCGHIHRAELTHHQNILYINCGDWVESATAVVEHHDGTLELWQIGERPEVLTRVTPRPATAAA